MTPDGLLLFLALIGAVTVTATLGPPLVFGLLAAWDSLSHRRWVRRQ